MRALADDPAVFDDENDVGIDDRGQAVRDDKRSSAADDCLYGILDRFFRHGVDGGSRFVKYKDLRIPAIYNILSKFKESIENDQRNESKSNK